MRVAINLSAERGPWLPLGHSAIPPLIPRLFGKNRFTPDDQRRHPDEPMTRLVKDVLRVGRWKVAVDRKGNPVFWTVTRGTLEEIARQHRLAQSRGVSMNLGKSHGDKRTGLIPVDELIAPIDEVIVDGEALWISSYVTPRQARQLKNPALKVSPGIRGDWLDGEGNKYPIKMVHVAVTDNPVVTGQNRFLAMSNHNTFSRRISDMAKKKGGDKAAEKRRQSMLARSRKRRHEEDEDEDDDNEFEFDLADEEDGGEEAAAGETIEGDGVPALIDLIDQVLYGAYGIHVPDTTTGETIVRDLQILLTAVGGEEEEPTEEEAPELIPESAGVALSNRQKAAAAKPGKKAAADAVPAWAEGLVRQVTDLANIVKERTESSAKDTFIARLREAGNKGVTAKALQRYAALGKRFGYDLALLDTLPEASIDMSNIGKKHANGKPPRTNGSAVDLSEEEVGEAAALIGGVRIEKKKK